MRNTSGFHAANMPNYVGMKSVTWMSFPLFSYITHFTRTILNKECVALPAEI